jgi:DNA helicase-2/ATP-dependent DNA helicase PcrA
VSRKLGRCEDCPSAYDEELFERLREWRAGQAREQSVPAYVVFTDATLTALAEVRPTTQTQLLAVSGIGRTKLERYGADVLGLCSGRAPDAPSTGTKQDVEDGTVTAVKKLIAPDGDVL